MSVSHTLQAQGIAGFVSKALEREAQREAQQAATGTAGAAGTAGGGATASDDEAPPGWTTAAEAPAHRLSQQQQGFAIIEDPDLAKTSGFALLLSQQLSLLQMTRQVGVQASLHVLAPLAGCTNKRR